MPLSNKDQTRVLKANEAFRDGKGHPMRFRTAVDLFCKECIYDDKGQGLGTWRKQVEDCQSLECPLWSRRPTANYSQEDDDATDGLDDD